MERPPVQRALPKGVYQAARRNKRFTNAQSRGKNGRAIPFVSDFSTFRSICTPQEKVSNDGSFLAS
jgi:hypothetical protein